jgi:hypothetical protein
MNYILRETAPPVGYSTQPLLEVLSPSGVDSAHGAVYVETDGGGQCVFVNLDLSALVNHQEGYCSGVTPEPAFDFDAGRYVGRVELMRTILEDLFGLPSQGGGGGGTSDLASPAIYRWNLAQNTPNPCVMATDIRFEVARKGAVSIKLYNAVGQLVRTLVNERREPGRYSVRWDRTNSAGKRVSSGAYFYRMQAGEFLASRKMIVVK